MKLVKDKLRRNLQHECHDKHSDEERSSFKEFEIQVHRLSHEPTNNYTKWNLHLPTSQH